MKLLVFSLLTILSCSQVIAFDIETIDETKEGIEKAKKKAQEVIRAKDGKIIVKALPKTIIKPMKVTIIQGYKPIIKPLKRKIIYPIGAIPPKIAEPKTDKPDTLNGNKEDLFLSKDEADKDSSPNEIKFKVDTNFKKHSDSEVETDKPNNIPPVNIE